MFERFDGAADKGAGATLATVVERPLTVNLKDPSGSMTVDQAAAALNSRPEVPIFENSAAPWSMARGILASTRRPVCNDHRTGWHIA